MSTQPRPITLLTIPKSDSIDGLISVFQDIYVKLGTIALDIDGYETFRDCSYLGAAKDTVEELEKVARLAQYGLIASKYSEEVPS